MQIDRESTNLDLMRSMAVLYVLGFHVYLFFAENHYVTRTKLWDMDLWQIGQWGVLIFFVHTCTVLMLSLERLEQRQPEGHLYQSFLIHRVFRIFPLSVFIVLLVASLGLPGALKAGHFVLVNLNWTDLFSNLLLVQNIFHTPSLSAPLWSLPYEMEMYLLLPLLYLLVRRTRMAFVPLALWVCAAILARHFYSMSGLPSNTSGGRPGFPDLLIYAPCFISGVVAYILSSYKRLNLPAVVWPFVLAGTTAGYLMHPSLPTGWICCLVLGVAIPQFRELTNPMLRRVLQTIARYSYGIYLTHFICIWFAFQLLRHFPMWLQWIVLAASVVACPYFLYHGVESPMIRLGKKVSDAMSARRFAWENLLPGRQGTV